MLDTDCHNVLKNFHKILTNANFSLFCYRYKIVLLKLTKLFGDDSISHLHLSHDAQCFIYVCVCLIFFMFVTCNLSITFFSLLWLETIILI